MKKKIFAIVLILAVLGVAGFFAGKSLLKEEVHVASTWYSEDKKEFVIETVEQLYELAELSVKNDFKGQTFKLGANLVINEGNATDWSEKAPEKKWYPIEDFNGTFDGQGYTISGLYTNEHYAPTGLFINIGAKAVIKDFKLINSYLKAEDSYGTAAIVGGSKNAGKIEKIYTDAIIDCDGRYTGGIVSILSGNSTISECQFDGVIYRHVFNDVGGGIVAAVATGRATMEHCLFSGSIYQDKTFYGYAKQHAKLGGLCGPVEGTSALTLKDCLSVGTIETKATSQIGAAVGFVSQTSSTTFDAVFTSTDTYRLNIGSNELYTTGSPILLQADMLKGENAYAWTNLDYDNYWTVVEDGTPELQCFADEKVSTEGLTRKFDVSWYNESDSEYTLTTIEQMYGLSLLSACKDFTGVTIKLGNDLTLNKGDASTWSKKSPEYTWIPILSWEGIFDGQGHTISGLYKVGGTGLALFGETKSSCEIRNLSVKNSYFANKKDTDNIALGGVVAQGGGILETLYSDVIIESTGLRAGGILGFVNCKDSDTLIKNCWYNGKITMYEKTGCCAGGILGQSYSNTNLLACLNTGEITGGGGNRIGGLVGNIGGTSVNKVENCLSVGKVTNSGGSQTGSFVGITGTSATAEVYDTYTSLESASKVIGSLKLGTYVGYASKIPTINLIGNGGYKWTSLDFNNYWTIVKDGTPVLRSFASTKIGTAGLEKKFDLSWYKEDKTAYEIKDAKDLYGLAILAGGGITFEGKTIKVGADIAVNTGDASTWATTAPSNPWIPVHDFYGTFDGQGHTISGLYKTDGTKVGLFATTLQTATVKNLSVKNSYFANMTETGNVTIGGVAGIGGGVFDNIYSDVILATTGVRLGGIVGLVNYDGTKISNCWYNGTIDLYEKTGCCGGGIVGQIYKETTINACLNTGTITGRGGNRTGGLLGNIGGTSTVTTKNSLNVGKVTNDGGSQTGGFVGVVGTSATSIVDSVYVTEESNSAVYGYTKIGVFKGYGVRLPKEKLVGIGGYQWTNLDFENNWSAVQDDTPMLKNFAGSSMSTAGVEKKFDTSWYKEDKKSYDIADAKDLWGLAMIASGGINFKDKAFRVTADIVVNEGDASTWAKNAPEDAWIPIKTFAGTFDGQGHTISGLYKKGGTKLGLIGETTKNAVVKNLIVENSYFANLSSTGNVGIGGVAGQGGGTFDTIYVDVIMEAKGLRVGGVIGYIGVAGTDINNCWFDGIINMKGKKASCAGGIAGQIFFDATITNCLNSGSIAGEGGNRMGGIVGNVGSDSIVQATDCLNVGTIKNSGSQTGSLVGVVGTGATLKMDSVYVTKESAANAIGSTKIGNFKGEVTSVDEANIYCHKAKENASGLDYSNIWSTLTKRTPILTSFATKAPNIVYAGVVADTSWYDKKDDEYTLTTKEQLYGLAELSCCEDFKGITINLGNDIVVNEGNASEWGTTAPEYAWESIQTFAGTFNGHGHTISGLYQSAASGSKGLFLATTEESEILNLSLENSYFENTSINNSVARVASIAACGAGTFDTIYSNAILKNNRKLTGGIVADATTEYGDLEIKNCLFAGTITTDSTLGKDYGFGGIVGWARNDKTTIENCMFNGEINYGTNNTRIAGIIARNGSGTVATQTDIENVLVVGTIAGTSNTASGQYIGAVYGQISGGTIDVSNAYFGNSVYKNGNISVDVELVTPGELTALTRTELDGENALTNASGLWDKNNTSWTTQAWHPVLTSFYWYNQEELVIRDAAELYDFAVKSKTDNFLNKTVKLGADITINQGTTSEEISILSSPIKWTAIGLNGSDINAFAGTFDGQGHTISGLYQVASSGSKGLFIATTSDSTIKNLKLVNSYFANTNSSNSTGRVGGIATYGAGLFESIYCDVLLKNNRKVAGGIVADATTAYGNLEVKNCWFAGNIVTDSDLAKDYSFGGIVGWARNNKTTISDCLFTGTIDYGTNNTRIAGILGRNGNKDSNGVITNTETIIKNVLVTGTIIGTSETASSQYIGYVYGQKSYGTIDVTGAYADNSVYSNKNTGVTVSLNKTGLTNGEPQDLSDSTANALFGDNANWIDTDAYEHPILTSFKDTEAKDAILVISTAQELLDFAAKSQTYNFKGVTVQLGRDITINAGDSSEVVKALTNPITWTPIGTKALPFAGIFDGQGYTISGIYCADESSDKGLFLATTPSSVIKDVRLVNSYIATTKVATGAKRTAGIAAYGEGLFDSIYCNVILENNAVVTGGIVADVQGLGGNLEIKNCWFAGTIKSANTSKNDISLGGIIGWARNCEKATITDCLFAGTIDYGTGKGTNNVYASGIVGRTTTTQIEMTRVLSVGTIKGSGGKKIDAICNTTPTVCEGVYENVTSDTDVTISTTPTSVGSLTSNQLSGNAAKEAGNADGLFAGDGATYWETGEKYPVLSGLSK